MTTARLVLPMLLAGMLACNSSSSTEVSVSSSPSVAATADWTKDTVIDVEPIDYELRAADGSLICSHKALRAAKGKDASFLGTFGSLDDWSALAASQSIALSWDAASSTLTIGKQVMQVLMVDPSKPEKVGVPTYGLLHNGMLYLELSPPAQHAMFPASKGSSQSNDGSRIVEQLQ